MSTSTPALARSCRYVFALRRDSSGKYEVDAEGGEITTLGADGEYVFEVRVLNDTEEGAEVLLGVADPSQAPFPFTMSVESDAVLTPRGEVHMTDFRLGAYRCSSDGRYVSNFFDPIYQQMRDARTAGCLEHQAQIEGVVQEMRGIGGYEIEWRMFDLAMCGASDLISDTEAALRASSKPDLPVHLKHELHGLSSFETIMMPPGLYDAFGCEVEDGMFDVDHVGAVFERRDEWATVVPKMVLDDWREIREFPQYLVEGVRAIFRHFMAGRIGDTPIEDIVRIHRAPGQSDDIAEVLLQSGFKELSLSAPFSSSSRLMTNAYGITAVRNFEGNGVLLIVFEDFAGAYAYAWSDGQSA